MGRSGAQRPPTAWAVEHSGGLLITYWLALTFFYIFVRPAVGTDFPDSSLFIAAAAAAHTAMAGIGFGAAEKEESSLWTAILPLLSFGGWTAMLSLCFTLEIGRFRAWSNAFSLDTASTASTIGAVSLTSWLVCAFLVRRSRIGNLAAGPLNRAHVAFALGALALLAAQVTPTICLAAYLGTLAVVLVL